jgi:ribonuclease BN (tRNA processing enzyme)
MFPGSAGLNWGFALHFDELAVRSTTQLGPFAITPFDVVHPSGAPSFAFRMEIADRVLAYSGDTEWTDTLIEAGRDADLFISECYSFESGPKFHLNYKTLRARIRKLKPKRILLTHMSEEMLAKLDQVTIDAAEDGQLLQL